jgi:hypothetical protein
LRCQACGRSGAPEAVAVVRGLPSRAGEHAGEILGEIGYAPGAIERLRAEGAGCTGQRLQRMFPVWPSE